MSGLARFALRAAIRAIEKRLASTPELGCPNFLRRFHQP
jgi:hypothetical protein